MPFPPKKSPMMDADAAAEGEMPGMESDQDVNPADPAFQAAVEAVVRRLLPQLLGQGGGVEAPTEEE